MVTNASVLGNLIVLISPSMIFNNSFWTASVATLPDSWPLFDILSNSSKITIACSALDLSLSHSNNKSTKISSMLLPTYPDCVSPGTEKISSLVSSISDNSLKIAVLPLPVGPVIRRFFLFISL